MDIKKITDVSTEILLPISYWHNNVYIKVATSENTRKAYRSDVRHFERWGGQLPAKPEVVVEYLLTFAARLNSRTLSRRLIALRHWHVYQGFADPTVHPAIQKTMIGITRTHGKPRDKAHPLTPADLIAICQPLALQDTLPALRDNALLQMGFFGAFRRSELANLLYENIEWKEQGIDVLIPHSKTDQNNEGQYCALPYGKSLLCPVTALKNWLKRANIDSGPLFRAISKGGQLGETSITPLSINTILKRRAREVQLSCAKNLSSHSLRRGFATSASLMGTSMPAIMRQGRWKQLDTVMEYISAGERFTDNAATSILEKISGTDKKA